MKYAKRTKDDHVDEAVVIELKTQVMEQEKIIKQLTEQYTQGGEVASNERTGLLTASTVSGNSYGSSTIGDSIPMKIAAVSVQPTSTTSAPEEAPTIPKSAMKQESAIKTPTSKSEGGLSAMSKDDMVRTKGNKTGPKASSDLTLETKPSDGTFIFKQPNAPPPR